MGLFKNIMAMLVIIAIIGVIVYYFNLFGFKSIVVPSVTPKTLPISKIINGSVGNNAYANYSSQFKIASNITKKYNEPINHTILFTGNSSNKTIETINQNDFLAEHSSPYFIKYNGLYVPIAQNISGEFVNNTSYIPSLIGKKVYSQFIATYDNNLTIQVPYIVQSEKIIGNMVYWHLIQDTGISNSTEINVNKESLSESNITISSSAGIYYNGTELLFPSD
jgi:hypothetical protein